jgi:hypothetical protein
MSLDNWDLLERALKQSREEARALQPQESALAGVFDPRESPALTPLGKTPGARQFNVEGSGT